MDIKIIKDITRLMTDNDLVEIEVESKDLKLKLRKATAPAPTAPATPHIVHALPAAAAPATPPAAPPAAAASARDEFEGCKLVISPIPGTVYLKPNPDAAHFVTTGAAIDETKVVCLIEAMKVFNEIKPDAGIRGQIRKVCVTDGQAVEYGTVLFLVG